MSMLAVAWWPSRITGVSSTAQLSQIFEEESKALVWCFCARGGCAAEPECLGQLRSEEAAAAAGGGGSQCPKAGGRASTGFSWRWLGGGRRRREPSLRKEHGRKRLGKCTADTDAEERASKGACPYSLSLQRGGRSFCEMWEKGLRFRDGESGRSMDTSGRYGWGRWGTASKWKIRQEMVDGTGG